MVDSDRAAVRKRNVKRRLRFFFVDDKLHRVLYVSRPQDLVEAWCFTDKKKVTFVWSHIKRNAGTGWHTSEVADILNRTHLSIERYLIDRVIPLPQMTHSLDGNFTNFKYIWSETDIIRMHEYLMTVHRGRPRKDGIIRPSAIPTRVELRALLKKDAVNYYVMNKDGKMVRAWKEKDW